MITKTQHWEVLNQKGIGLETAKQHLSEIEHYYPMVKLMLTNVTDDYVEIDINVQVPIGIQTVEQYHNWLTKQFDNSSEFDAISNLWEEQPPKNLLSALELTLKALDDSIRDWIIESGE